VYGPCQSQGEKRCEVKGGNQEMAVMLHRLMAKIFIMIIQANFVPSPGGGHTNLSEFSLLNFLPLTYVPSQQIFGRHL